MSKFARISSGKLDLLEMPFLIRIRYFIICLSQAVRIQAVVRAWLQRRAYKKKIESIIRCQCAVRRHQARRRYKELKREARSMEHMKKLNKGLENKIISMQQKITELVTFLNH